VSGGNPKRPDPRAREHRRHGDADRGVEHSLTTLRDVTDDGNRRLERREAARRAVKRRRGFTALGLLALAGVAVVWVTGQGGSSGSRATTRTPAIAPRSGSREHRRQVAPGPGAHRAPREPVPILMYHLINAPPSGAALPDLWVPRDQFAAQVQYLAAKGYHAVTLQQAWDAWHHGGRLPAKPIVFSFDDGYHSQFSNGFAILHARDWPGVLNLEVKLVGSDLKPKEIRAMIAAGWEVDAHTLTHPDLTTVGPSQLQQEVAGSRQRLRRLFGVPVNFFCYPAGRFSPAVIGAVRHAGYLGATTTAAGYASPDQPPFELRRIRVHGNDGVAGLSRDLAQARLATHARPAQQGE
jgi:peptidoglycan/xylan/chitin deacetylase (PgdA/CDA1 family)